MKNSVSNRAPAKAPVAEQVPARLPLLFVHTDDQWEAMASSVRVDVLMFLTATGPMPVVELSCLMNAAADGLYHHVRLLVKAGLIREVGLRRVGKRTEKMYDAVAERLKLDVDPASGRNAGRLVKHAQLLTQRAERALEAALAAKMVRVEEPAPNLFLESETAWLDDEDLAQVRQHLEAIKKLFVSRRASRRGGLHCLTMTLTPLIRSRSSRVRVTGRLAAVEAATLDQSPSPRRARALKR